jgi:hypothetical protein
MIRVEVEDFDSVLGNPPNIRGASMWPETEYRNYAYEENGKMYVYVWITPKYVENSKAPAAGFVLDMLDEYFRQPCVALWAGDGDNDVEMAYDTRFAGVIPVNASEDLKKAVDAVGASRPGCIYSSLQEVALGTHDGLRYWLDHPGEVVRCNGLAAQSASRGQSQESHSSSSTD